MGKTSIEWTDVSWPVINGCRRVSRGCENCYAERLAATRLAHLPKYQGLAVIKRGPPKVLRRDFADGSVGLRQVDGKARPQWTGEARLWAKDLDMPLRLRKPSRIFVCDMGDLFYEEVPDEQIAAVFGVMAACPQHTFQVLTKRPERMREWFRWVEATSRATRANGACGDLPAEVCRAFMIDRYRAEDGSMPEGLGRRFLGYDRRWPLPNVWLGVSVEDQKTADDRVSILLEETPAALRFISAEPLLDRVELFAFLKTPLRDECMGNLGAGDTPGLDWVIVGGESGPGARTFDLDWARAIVTECQKANVPVFMKQIGAYAFDGNDHVKVGRKGGDMDAWPPWISELRIREFPSPRGG